MKYVPVMLGKKRGSEEDGDKSELCRKRVKTRDLKSVFCSEGRRGRKTLQEPIGPTHGQLDLNANAYIVKDFSGDDTNRLPSPGKHEIECNVDHVISREFGFYLNPKDVSSSINYGPFHPSKNYNLFKSRDDSECGSPSGPLEERDAIRISKEMKQNGFLSSSQVGVLMPKPRGRKSKADRLKKKMELAQKEHVDKFAKIAAPSGLLNGLSPGIINGVRNTTQVHSIIDALVRSEKRENCHAGSKQSIQTKSGKEEFCDRKDLENLNVLGMNRIPLCPGSHILLGSKKIGGCPISMKNSVTLNSGITREDGDSSMAERRVLGKNTCPSHSNPDSEDDILALKLSSSMNIFSENASSLSNEKSTDLPNVTSLSVEAANVASQWSELLHQDIKGRLAEVRRSKKRVEPVMHTDLPNLMSREFSSIQENNPYVPKNSAAEFSDSPTSKAHQTRRSALFDQMDMDKALSEGEKQLVENALHQTVKMLRQNGVNVTVCSENNLNRTLLRENVGRQNVHKNARSSNCNNVASSSIVKPPWLPVGKENTSLDMFSKDTDLTTPQQNEDGVNFGCSVRQLAQRARRDREKLGITLQPRFFPGLPPTRLQRACRQREERKRARTLCGGSTLTQSAPHCIASTTEDVASVYAAPTQLQVVEFQTLPDTN